MMIEKRSMLVALIAFMALVLFCALAWKQSGESWRGLWRSPDRQGQLLMEKGEYLPAAERFTDPMQRGSAYFKAGEFKKALSVYNSVVTPEGVYNRGNAQMMLGSYDSAIALYDRALEERPGWEAATANRAIAVARKAALAPPESDDGGTGGQLEADEIVFDDQAKNGSSEQEVDGGEAMSDDEMRGLWLRKVQTKPADFLRAKFSYQFQREKSLKTSKP